MRDYGPGTYGDLWADVYDDWTGERFGEEATAAAVERLASLAEGGRVRELAIGTGRVALPLVERGLEVHGIDASTEMVSKLRAKPGGDGIDVTIGDFADVGVEGRFDLVFVLFNTLFALTSQRDQVRCFRNVAEHLTEGGRFVVEAFVPDLARFEDELDLMAQLAGLVLEEKWSDWGGAPFTSASRSHISVYRRRVA